MAVIVLVQSEARKVATLATSFEGRAPFEQVSKSRNTAPRSVRSATSSRRSSMVNANWVNEPSAGPVDS